MRFEVPQFIEIEDKIIGPLTWKQFVYVAGGVGILVILYFTLPLILFVVVGIPFAILSASLAFHKVNSRPFSVFLEAFVSYAKNSKLYLWRKGEVQSVIEREEPESSGAPAGSTLSFTGKGSIATLARKLDLQATPTDHG